MWPLLVLLTLSLLSGRPPIKFLPEILVPHCQHHDKGFQTVQADNVTRSNYRSQRPVRAPVVLMRPLPPQHVWRVCVFASAFHADQLVLAGSLRVHEVCILRLVMVVVGPWMFRTAAFLHHMRVLHEASRIRGRVTLVVSAWDQDSLRVAFVFASPWSLVKVSILRGNTDGPGSITDVDSKWFETVPIAICITVRISAISDQGHTTQKPGEIVFEFKIL